MNKKIEILAVDGNAGELAVTIDVLREAGYTATGAETFQMARCLLSRQRYDLLITEVRLRAYNGIHLVFHSQRLYPETAAIVVARHPDRVGELEARRLGACYIDGPADRTQLLAVVGSAVADRLNRQPPD